MERWIRYWCNRLKRRLDYNEQRMRPTEGWYAELHGHYQSTDEPCIVFVKVAPEHAVLLSELYDIPVRLISTSDVANSQLGKLYERVFQ